MRIIISSLQVSTGGSKGHLHPAIEVSLALKKRGHHIAFLPLPSPPGKNDEKQIKDCGFELLETPLLPEGVIYQAKELARLAKNPETTADAYHSFLVAPLKYQFEAIQAIIQSYSADIVVYDLLVYGAALAARALQIPDIGFCAGLKLAAPKELTTIYQASYEKLRPKLSEFMNENNLNGKFQQLELLASTYQMVFTPKVLFDDRLNEVPPNTRFTGALPLSAHRDTTSFSFKKDAHEKLIIYSFGSVYDPADYPHITDAIIYLAKKFNCQLLIVSRKGLQIKSSNKIKVYDYLPLISLLDQADIFIHHGGANSFSEAMRTGAPQILIPLAVDQPIQADILNRSKAGIAIAPNDVTECNLDEAFTSLLDLQNPLHRHRKHMQRLFNAENGAENAAKLIEQAAEEYENAKARSCSTFASTN